MFEYDIAFKIFINWLELSKSPFDMMYVPLLVD
jgi:hypothetical protein